MEHKKPSDLKWICSIIIIWAVPSFVIGSILLSELFFANMLFSYMGYTLTGLFATSMGAFFFTIAIGLLSLKTWAYKIVIPLSLVYLLILIPSSVILNLIYHNFNFDTVQHIALPLVLNIWILTFFSKKRIKSLYIKK